jgi:electron transport complex protein RnfB
VIEQINALLPQTQCGQCGFKGCRPYAQALAEGRADINQCPPGGDEGIMGLAQLLGVPPKPLNPEFGSHKPKQVAFVIEQDCIGCVKCIAACPVDAIVGAAKFMHTVIAAECTGCELCVAPCPVDCIVMKPADADGLGKREQAALAKRRYEARLLRKAMETEEKAERARQKKAAFMKTKSSK